MKKLFTISMMISFFLLTPSFGNAQFDIGRRIKKDTKKAVNRAADKTADKGIDEAEKGIDKVYENGDKDEAESREQDNKSTAKQNDSKATAENTASASSQQDPLKAYSKYNFVPGDEVIFEDNLANEENGEFPSKWDLKYGNAEIARYGDEYVINFPDVNYAKIVPLMAEKGDYLPEKFTVEFDAYFSEFCTRYKVIFYDMINQKSTPGLPDITVSPTGVSVEGYGSTNIQTDNKEYPFWKRIAISFNIRSLKVFYGEQRTNNIPNLKANPSGITIFGGMCHGGHQAMIKNIRIAKGNTKLYDRVVTDGRFTTNGIRFDVGKASIRPESMGVINEIYNMMKDHPELRFSVQGHTDSDGDETTNMALSKDRANAVVIQLVSMGIESGRFEAKGFGESKPVDTNNTPEGKANNRRVEFVKI
jgi:OmpA-OmpF porin, OOP family